MSERRGAFARRSFGPSHDTGRPHCEPWRGDGVQGGRHAVGCRPSPYAPIRSGYVGWKSGLLDPHSYVPPPQYPRKIFGRSQILGPLSVRYYQNFWGGFKIHWPRIANHLPCLSETHLAGNYSVGIAGVCIHPASRQQFPTGYRHSFRHIPDNSRHLQSNDLYNQSRGSTTYVS